MTFRLDRHAREFYELEIVTDPQIVAWEASFDGGTTWDAAEAVPGDPGWFRWLLAGDRAELGAAVAQLAPTGDRDLVPKVRTIANPQIVILRGVEPIRVE